MKGVHARRKHGVRRALPAAAAGEAFRAHLAARKELLIAGIALASPKYADVARAVVTFAEGGGPLDAFTAGAAATLAIEWDPQSKNAEVVVDGLFALGGPAFAVASATASANFFNVTRATTHGNPALVLGPPVVSRTAWQDADPIPELWSALRERLSTLEDAPYTEARKAAEAVRADKAGKRLLALLAFAFPAEAAWGSAVVEMLDPQTKTDGYLASLLLSSLEDPSAVQSFVERFQPSFVVVAEAAANLVDGIGEAAEACLLETADELFGVPYGMEALQKTFATSLARVGTSAVATFFAANMTTNKYVKPAASGFFGQHPALALAHLGDATVPSAEARAQHKALLGQAVRAHPTLARQAAESRSREVAPMLHALLAEAETVPDEASESDLPPLLVAPPWHGKADAKKKTTLSLSPLPFEETMTWHAPPEGVRHITSPRGDDAMLAALEKRLAARERVCLYEAADLSDEALLALLERTDTAAWAPWFLHHDLPTIVERFELRGVDVVLRFAAKKPHDAAHALAVVASPRVAPLMAHVLQHVRRTRRLAERWLIGNARAAAIGLLPLAFGKAARPRSSASRALRFLVARGKEDVVRAAAKAYGAAAAKALDEVLTLDPSEGAPKKPPALPAFFDPASLPRPVLLSGKALPVSAVRILGEMLAFTDPDEPYAGLEEVRAIAAPDSLARFAWALFEAFLLAGAPAEEKWAFFALAHFGGDAEAERLAPMIRRWPTEGAFPRAVVGLQVLAAMKSETALALLHGISEKVKSRPLLLKAKELVESVAESMGLSPEELADRIVPTLGLDPDGSKVFDFGARRFRVGFDEHLKPFVRSEAGETFADLPKAGKNDDAERVAGAAEEWKALKKSVKALAAREIGRLESAMIAQRRWEPAAFVSFVVRHPLVAHLARRLVFAAWDEDGGLLGTFRVAEDGSLADLDDAVFTLPTDAKVGVVHPLELDGKILTRWGTVLADYEILQPFAQLGREVKRAAAKDLENFAPTVDTLKLLGLERRGWRRGPVGDGGVWSSFEKEAGGNRATLHLDPGIYAGDPKMYGSQTPRQIDFSNAKPDVIFLSEVAHDLAAVGAI